MRNLLVACLFTFFVGCKTEHKNKVDVSHIVTKVNLKRFDNDFYTSSKAELPNLKRDYPMLFPHNIDSVWVHKMNDKDEQELYDETQKLYADFSLQEAQIKSLFQHIKYYSPSFREPIVVTLLTNMDSRVVYTSDFLFISLDNFLGKNHVFYADYPKYIKQNNTKEHLIVDVASAIIDKQVPSKIQRRFIDKMIYEGKKMYLLSAYLPEVSDQEKNGYSKEKFDWAVHSEEQIWQYFIENNLLYSTDAKLSKRFLEVAPFSKFYLGDDTLSPGQIGRYIGWQIVRAYMQNNAVSLRQLMQTSTEEIFKKSKYKPKR